jgi:ABC-type Fe3+/spermidine/putrescine transport system ATPase subunit
MNEGAVHFEQVSHRYGTTKVLDDVTLTVQQGEFLTILGPSGSGKSTLLQLVAGLAKPSEGRVLLAGRDVTDLPPQKRNVGFVFQSYALFPHLTVADNVMFPLKVAGMDAERAKARVQEVLGVVELRGYEDRYPSQLSGGQQQRVAVGRAIASQPKVLLLDEPLGALDRRLRQALGRELRHLQRQTGITMVYVTHDQEEAFSMSDRIVVIHEGRIRQVGPPATVYNAPDDIFVASFLGDLTAVEGHVEVEDGQMAVTSGASRWCTRTDAGAFSAGERVLGVVRPENVWVASSPIDLERGPHRGSGIVEEVTFQGSRRQIVVRQDAHSILAEVSGADAALTEGAPVDFGWHDDDVVVVRPEAGLATAQFLEDVAV